MTEDLPFYGDFKMGMSRTILAAGLVILFAVPVWAEPGLNTEWWNGVGDQGIAGVDAFLASNTPTTVPIFVMNNQDGANAPSGPHFGGPVGFPSTTDLPDPGFRNRAVRWTGQIFIPESGTYNFKDGIDQTTRLRIGGQEIIADSLWAGFDGSGGDNGGSAINQGTFNVKAGGEWLDFEFFMSEGCCGDQSSLYWDYDQTNGLNANPDFPAVFTDPAGTGALIPGSQFRTEAEADVVPEPATLAIWSLLGLVGAAWGWRRFQRK